MCSSFYFLLHLSCQEAFAACLFNILFKQTHNFLVECQERDIAEKTVQCMNDTKRVSQLLKIYTLMAMDGQLSELARRTMSGNSALSYLFA